MRKLGLRLLLICLLLAFFGYFQIYSKYVVSLSVCSLSRMCIKIRHNMLVGSAVAQR